MRSARPPESNKTGHSASREHRTCFMGLTNTRENWNEVQCFHPWWPQTNVMALCGADSPPQAWESLEIGLSLLCIPITLSKH